MKIFGTAKKFVSSVLPAVIKPLRVLWNELIAFTFFVLGAIALPSAWRSYNQSNGDFENVGRFLLAKTFAVIMIGYGIHSLLRARKINKS